MMKMNNNNLPQLSGKMFLTDGGLETSLIFDHGLDLPHFASFPLILDLDHRHLIRDYFVKYIEISKKNRLGFILESPTFRSNTDWGFRLGYDQDELNSVNKESISQLIQLKDEYEDETSPIVVSGCVGPRGDGYVVSNKMSIDEAKEYHLPQINAFKEAGADMITCYTINYIEEAVGIALAAKECDVPAAIGFTVETNGELPSGDTLQDGIEAVDLQSDGYPSYFMINCAHPTHFADKLKNGGQWVERIMSIRANASTKSHAELDESTSLDSGDMTEFKSGYGELKELLPNLKVVGGCCGTSHTHIESICSHWE